MCNIFHCLSQDYSVWDSYTHFIPLLTVYVRTVADGVALHQYHALTTFQNFWNAIPEENLLAVPLDPIRCKVIRGFAGRT